MNNTPSQGQVAGFEYIIFVFGLLGLALTACKALKKQDKDFDLRVS